MIRRLMKSVREYKRPTVLTLIFIVGEAVIETFIPFITANLVNRIKAGADMSYILETGGVLALMACASLACGGLAGLVYAWLAQKNRTLAAVTAAIVCPVVNTGVFLLGCRIFFLPMLADMAQNLGFGDNVGRFMIIGLVGINFLAELGINIVLSPVILRLIRIGRKEN